MANGEGNGNGEGTQVDGEQKVESPQSQFDKQKLNPWLRGLDEQQLNEVFETLMNRMPQNNAPQNAAPAAPPAKPDYKEMLDPNSEKFNPEAAFGDYVQRNYSGLLSDIKKDTTEAIYASLRGQIPDFDEYERDVRTLLQQRDPMSISQGELLNTYYAVKGFRISQKDMQARRNDPKPKGNTTIEPSPEDTNEEVKLSPEQEMIARRLFGRFADPIAEYKKHMNSDTVEVKVPIGGGQKV